MIKRKGNQRMRKTLPTICLSVSALLFSTAAYGGEEIRIGGGGAALHTVFQPLKPHFEKASGITLINLQSSPKDGQLNLLEGRVDVSAAAHSLDTLLASLAEDGVKIDRSRLIEHHIGVNRMTVIAHPDNRLNRLTRQQIKAIFTGQVVNWQEVGGDDRDPWRTTGRQGDRRIPAGYAETAGRTAIGLDRGRSANLTQGDPYPQVVECQVGATHLAKLCQEVEEQARIGHSDSILDREKRISKEVPRVLAALGEQRQRNPASPQTEGVNPCS